MGWTWALFFAKEAVTHQVSLSAGAVPGDAMRERNPIPVIAPGRPVVGTYVVNIQVIGSSAKDVDDRWGGVEKPLLDLGIPFDLTHTSAQLVLQTIGLEYDFANRRLRNVPGRVWRFVYATRALLRRSRMTGKTMEVWLGHAVSLLQLTRPALSCLSAVYRFRAAVGDGRIPVWPSVMLEMRMAMSLVLLTEVNLAAPMCAHVH